MNVRVGVGCLITSSKYPGCILMGKRMGSHGAGKFATPGGHLELSESWESCAQREVKEETNLDVENIQFLHVTNDPSIGGDINKHYITIFMLATLPETSAELINLEPHKCEEWIWMPWYSIVQLVEAEPSRLFDPMIHLIQTIPSEKRTLIG